MRMQSIQHSGDRRIQDLLAKRDFKHAEILLNEKLRASPTSADTHYLFGVYYYFQGKISEAIRSLKASLLHDPKHTDAAICLSVLYNDIGKYEEAKSVFDVANQSVSHTQTGDNLEVDRKFAVKHLELADLYFRYRRYDEAVEEYSKAALLDPTALEIRIRRAKAYAKKGYISRAIQELQLIKQENPDFAQVRIQLGLLYYSQGNLLDAELEWESALTVDPSHREAQAYLEMARSRRQS